MTLALQRYKNIQYCEKQFIIPSINPTYLQFPCLPASCRSCAPDQPGYDPITEQGSKTRHRVLPIKSSSYES